MTNRFSFTISATDGKARTGAVQMQRGEIRTPAYEWSAAASIERAFAMDDWHQFSYGGAEQNPSIRANHGKCNSNRRTMGR